MIALPPSFGATKVTATCAFPGATVGCAGGAGTVLGTTTAEAGDAGPSPFAFVAVTVHVYDLPLESPVTTSGDVVPLAESAMPPFDDAQFAVYPVIALPPSSGAPNDTVIFVLPGITEGCAGGDGTVLGTTGADSGDAGPGPSSFVAVTVQVYDLPLVTPPTTIGDAAPTADEGVPPLDDAQLTA